MDRFPALTTISAIVKGLAVLVVLVGFIAGVRSGDVIAAFTIWIIAAVQALGLFAFGELIGVFCAIEENTRQAADTARQTDSAMRRLLTPAGSPSQAAVPAAPRAQMRASTATPSWLAPKSTTPKTPKTGWSAIDDIERDIQR